MSALAGAIAGSIAALREAERLLATPTLRAQLDFAVEGQALTIAQPHRRFGQCYAEFVRHAGDGKHIYVRKLISSMYRARWTAPLKIERAQVLSVHLRFAQA